MQPTLTVMPFSRRGAVIGLDVLFQPSNESRRFNQDLNDLGFMGQVTPEGDISGHYRKRRNGKTPSETLAELMEWVWAHNPKTVVHVRPTVRIKGG